MIKVKCDICGKEDLDINTLVLINKKIDYCNNPACIRKSKKIRVEIEKELEMQKRILYSIMRKKQNQILKLILKK